MMDLDPRSLDSFYAELSPKLAKCRAEQQKRDRYEASDFSVFEYIDPDENRLSDILHDLLDPSGAHGQGATFLTSFLTMVGVPHKSAHKHCQVKREDRTQASRRIDITIRLDGFVIGIENKPWANESENQLHDYWVDLRKRFGKNCMLVYLSGDGSDPATLRRRDLTNLRSTGQFKTLAYSTDLCQWLEQCHEECEAERVRWFLRDLADYASKEFNLTEVPDSDP